MRFPRLVALLARIGWWIYVRLPPRSRLRTAVTRRYVLGAAAALSRGDVEAAFALWHPDVEAVFDQGLVALGAEPVYRGHRARVEFQRRWNAEWGEWGFMPEELIAVGDSRLLVIGHLRGRGLGSGVEVDTECGFLATISGGLVTHERVFFSRGEALAAVGLVQ